MKILFIGLAIAVALLLTGCGRLDRFFAGLTGDASEICHDGVKYLQFTSGATVKYKYDELGNFAPEKCN